MTRIDKTLGQVGSISNQVQTGVNAVQTLAGALGLGNTSKWAPWFSTLRPAKWRGLTFAVLSGQIRAGRRQVVHEYPYRDVVWVEDMGRAAQRITMTGFLVGDDVIAQRDAFIKSAEQAGEGQLTHPTLGLKRMALVDFSAEEKWDQGRYIELQFSFVEAGQRQYPQAVQDTPATVNAAAAAAKKAANADFISKASAAIAKGTEVVAKAAEQAAAVGRKAQNIVNGATNVAHMVSTISGSVSRFVGQHSAQNPSATLMGLLALGAMGRANVSQTVDALTNSAGQPSTFAPQTHALASAMRAATPDPAAAVQMLVSLAGAVEPVPVVSASTSGAAMQTVVSASTDLFRRAAVIGIAQASASYTPTSFDDAVALRATVVALLDEQINTASAHADDATYAALRTLRTAVMQDLQARGSTLATLKTVSLGANLPALVLAQRLYQDPARAPELVRRVAPVHPLFMPRDVRVLAS
jgi:prophage DNA circulation protein